MKQKVLQTDQIKAIQEGLSGYFINQVIDLNGKYYYDKKEILPSSHTTKDLG
jgi:hypothetical protein